MLHEEVSFLEEQIEDLRMENLHLLECVGMQEQAAKREQSSQTLALPEFSRTHGWTGVFEMVVDLVREILRGHPEDLKLTVCNP